MSSVTITPSGRDLIIGSAHHANTLLVERADLDDLISGLQRAVEKPPAFKPTFLDVQFGHKSPLLEALELIGPAQSEEHFQVRWGIARLIVLGVCREYRGRPILLGRDNHIAGRELDRLRGDLGAALAGTEFTAQIQLLPGNRINVDIDPKRFISAGGVIYTHDCGQCISLGQFVLFDADHPYDLYFCAKSVPTVIARYGNNGHEYESGIGSKSLPLLEAERRSCERGLL